MVYTELESLVVSTNQFKGSEYFKIESTFPNP